MFPFLIQTLLQWCLRLVTSVTFLRPRSRGALFWTLLRTPYPGWTFTTAGQRMPKLAGWLTPLCKIVARLLKQLPAWTDRWPVQIVRKIHAFSAPFTLSLLYIKIQNLYRRLDLKFNSLFPQNQASRPLTENILKSKFQIVTYEIFFINR